MTEADQRAPEPTADGLLREAIDFRSGFSTLLMATVDTQGEPDASYAPYVEEDGAFYVFVSDLSPHTKNLLRSGRVSVLFIEDESATRNLFARRRLSYHCGAAEVAASDARFGRILGRLEARFGRLIRTLHALPDFHLVCLVPEHGRYVTGFGKAFRIEDPRRDTFRRLRG